MNVVNFSGRIAFALGILSVGLFTWGLFEFGNINKPPGPPKIGYEAYWPFIIAETLVMTVLPFSLKAYLLKAQRISATAGLLIFVIWLSYKIFQANFYSMV